MSSKPDAVDPKQVVAQGYDKVAHEYARLEGDTEWPRMRWLTKVLDRLQPGASVLDLGCGSGDPADIAIAKTHRVTGVDISQTQIELARQNVPDGDFIHGDAGSVDFPPDSFDAVVSFYTLEHIPRREHRTILQRIYQWLRTGGLLLLAMEAGEYDDYMGEWLGVPMFISCFPPETIKEMVRETGFELLESAIESQAEQSHDVPFLWILAQKQ